MPHEDAAQSSWSAEARNIEQCDENARTFRELESIFTMYRHGPRRIRTLNASRTEWHVQSHEQTACHVDQQTEYRALSIRSTSQRHLVTVQRMHPVIRRRGACALLTWHARAVSRFPHILTFSDTSQRAIVWLICGKICQWTAEQEHLFDVGMRAWNYLR